FERPREPGEHLADLAVKIGGERAARGILDRHLSGEPDRTAAFGNDRLRIGAGLRRLALDVASLQRFRHLSPHLVRQRSMLRAMASNATSFFENVQRRTSAMCWCPTI